MVASFARECAVPCEQEAAPAERLCPLLTHFGPRLRDACFRGSADLFRNARSSGVDPSVARLRRPDCREKTLDLLLQALGLLCELAGRTENHFGGSSHLARCLRHAGNVLHDPLRALRASAEILPALAF